MGDKRFNMVSNMFPVMWILIWILPPMLSLELLALSAWAARPWAGFWKKGSV